jgi:VWFA-related protein
VVDVVVTDAANQSVKGLGEHDFRVFENNKEQRILSFEAHEPSSERPASEKPGLPPNTFSNATSFPPDSINVILLDQLNTSIEDQKLARDAVIDFLAHKPAGAAFAIFTLRNDEEACHPSDLARASFGLVNSPVSDPDWSCPSRGRLLLVHGITQDKDRLTAALKTDLARPRRTWFRQMAGSGLVLGQPSLTGMLGVNPWTLAPVRVGWIFGRNPFGVFLPSGIGDSYETNVLEVYDTTMSHLAEIGHFLQDLPGRKSLIWMSDQFDAAPIAQDTGIWFPPKFKGWENTDPFSPTQMLHLTAGRLALDRVALYAADLSGNNSDVDVRRICGGMEQIPGTLGLMMVPGGPITSRRSRSTCDFHAFRLSYLASQSGGKAFHGSRRIDDALVRAAYDESNYYSLTYLPGHAKFDGKVRSIKVIVNQRTCHLAYRKHYYGDDPVTLNRPMTAESPDLYVPATQGPIPWRAVRVSDLVSSKPQGSDEPIWSNLRYGAPEINSLNVSVHVEPTARLTKATAEQVKALEEYESLRKERIQNAMEHLTAGEKKTQHKGRTVLDALPPAEPVFVQPYSLDYFIPGKQLSLALEDKNEHAFHVEVAILAYDALGQRVTGLKDDIRDTVSDADLEKFQSSDYKIRQTIQIPDRATVLRLAVRDVSSNRVGSLEIPVWAISSPYRRKQLELPLGTVSASQHDR